MISLATNLDFPGGGIEPSIYIYESSTFNSLSSEDKMHFCYIDSI